MSRYSLVGVDGNAYSIMGYTMDAMKAAGMGDEVNTMLEEAKSGDYNNLIAVCCRYIDKVNAKVEEGDIEDEE